MVHDVFVRDIVDLGSKRCVALEEAVEQIIGTLFTQMSSRRYGDGAIERDRVEQRGLGVNALCDRARTSATRAKAPVVRMSPCGPSRPLGAGDHRVLHHRSTGHPRYRSSASSATK